MTDAYKKIQIVGTSPKSFYEAAANAVAKAAQSESNLSWFEVVEERGAISGGKNLPVPGDAQRRDQDRLTRPESSRWWSTRERLTQGLQVLSHFHPFPVVHCQQLHGRAANRRPTGEDRPFPREMICPTVAAWMKQRHKLPGLGIEAGDVGSLVEIAEAARQGQVVRLGRATMLTGNDVFDVKTDETGSRLRQSAVFANVTCPAADQGPQRVVHHCCPRSSDRALACNTAITSMACR